MSQLFHSSHAATLHLEWEQAFSALEPEMLISCTTDRGVETPSRGRAPTLPQ